jgi:uncharacterized membrane protein YjgN (DUF898 family)
MSVAQTDCAFEFRGRTDEYFRIWIVNLALSIVTLGVFTAWAKVRRERYFYGNTWVAGAPFQYLASPINILKGRVIAVTLLAAYVLAGQLSVIAQLVVLLIVGIAMPWLVVSALRFRARYSAWSSLNFRFAGELNSAINYYMLMYLLIVPTLGLIYPYIKYRQRRFVIHGHRFGGRPFEFNGTGADYYAIYLAGSLVAAGAAFIVVCAGVAVAFALKSWIAIGAPAAENIETYTLLAAGLIYGSMFCGWIYIAAHLTNLNFNAARLAANRFRSTLRARDLIWIYATNTLAILASVGLLMPWAQIRLARYRAQHLTLAADGDIDAFVAELQADRTAAGAEAATLFDVDMSL